MSLAKSARIPLLASLLAGCGTRGTLTGDLYRDSQVAFRIGPLPPEWRRVQVADGQLAFHHDEGGTILAHATCEGRGDASLDVLTNHLLFGIEEPRERSRTPLSLDGRRALRTRVDGALDGVPIALDLATHWFPQVSFDGTNYLVVWQQLPGSGADQTLAHINGARVTPAGAVLDSPSIAISSTPQGQYSPVVAFDGTNYLVAWEDQRQQPGDDIYAVRVSSSGAQCRTTSFVAPPPAMAYPPPRSPAPAA